ncbi:MAG TPA: hypothetical protein VMV99_11990 [Rhodanobacter sp.]|nr:hypothetical protein [Rhodanobacter sp.]
MNEQERRSNHVLHALDEAHRLGRITRAQYRARRRALLVSLSDSNGVTARNAIVTRQGPSQHRVDSTRMAAADTVNEASTLFPERRAALRRLWLVVGGMVLVALLLVYWMVRRSAP